MSLSIDDARTSLLQPATLTINATSFVKELSTALDEFCRP